MKLRYKFIGKSCWLEKEKTLVISDLHIGYEEMMREQGVFLPKFQYEKTIKELNEIFSKVGKVKEIIILGDLKHEFSGISGQEWKEVFSLIKFLKEKTNKIVLVKGNHDNYLVNVVKKQGIKLVEIYIKKDIAFLHGHRVFPEVFDTSKTAVFECHQKSTKINKISEGKIKKIFLGHMHPAISIQKGVKKEIYKCFLAGKFKGKEVIILPSFFPLVEGQDVFIEDTNLAIKLELKNFEVYVPVSADEVYEFGKLKGVGKLA